MFALFRQVNDRVKDRRLPDWLGLSAAILYLVWSMGDRILDRLHIEPIWLRIASLGIFLCNLPAVIATERLNGPESAVTRANSRLSWHTAVALAVGALFWILVIIGLSS
jgi:hypothetical protein